jgi:phosphoenolpyruvate-protein phosphotransferase
VSTKSLVIVAPLPGWCLPLAQVPDPVFAERMAGDGVAIDPTGNTLHAPCDGEIVPMQGAKHAVTVRSALGIDVLAHVGIDTVKLGGRGFEMLVTPGERVRAGQALLRFDLDLAARGAASLVTPLVLASPGTIVKRIENRAVKVGDFLMEIAAAGVIAPDAHEPSEEMSCQFEVPFEHGLHVRPAALVVAALRPFKAEVAIACRGRSGNARSTVALMSLGVHCGDLVEVTATGADALQALAALEPLLAPAKPHRASAPAAARAPAAAGDRRRIEAPIASRGIALGQAVQWSQAEIPIAERGEDPAGEAAALDRALAAVKAHLETLVAAAEGEQQAVLGAHVELIQDPGLRLAADDWLRRGKSAAFAWRQATRATTEALIALGDPRMRERSADLRDLELQALRVLAGRPPASQREFAPGSIVLADDILPSQMIALARSRVSGICTARGGPTSHVAILAAASGIPALVAAGPEILSIVDGTVLVLDAEHGWLDIDPPAAEVAAMQRAVAQRAAERAEDMEAAHGEAKTRDGIRVKVKANLGSFAETRGAIESGAEGCGLLRTEFLFLDRREPPGEDEQAAEYQRIATGLEERPLNIRTMDIGGDKPIAYLPLPREDNPALGMRGVRASLSQPELLRSQLRAVLRVQPAGQCRVLLPMVTDLDDLKVARTMLADGARELGVAVPQLGVMIETPASALLAEQLADGADFLSIGTNDLSQYTLAIDRGHPELAKRLDALHPAVLRLIALVADAAHARGKSVAVCGALGSDVDALPILIGLGIHEISATPAIIPRLKRMVRLLDAAECAELAQRALEQETAAAVRDLAAYARARARASKSEPLSEGSP